MHPLNTKHDGASRTVKFSMLPSRQNTSVPRGTESGTKCRFPAVPEPLKQELGFTSYPLLSTAILSGLLLTPPDGPFCWLLLLKADFTLGGQTLGCKVKGFHGNGKTATRVVTCFTVAIKTPENYQELSNLTTGSVFCIPKHQQGGRNANSQVPKPADSDSSAWEETPSDS